MRPYAALRAAFLWALAFVLVVVLLRPIGSLWSAGGPGLVVAVAIAIFLASSILAAGSLSLDLLSGRYDEERGSGR